MIYFEQLQLEYNKVRGTARRILTSNKITPNISSTVYNIRHMIKCWFCIRMLNAQQFINTIFKLFLYTRIIYDVPSRLKTNLNK